MTDISFLGLGREHARVVKILLYAESMTSEGDDWELVSQVADFGFARLDSSAETAYFLSSRRTEALEYLAAVDRNPEYRYRPHEHLNQPRNDDGRKLIPKSVRGLQLRYDVSEQGAPDRGPYAIAVKKWAKLPEWK